jgi:hypothetical protein
MRSPLTVLEPQIRAAVFRAAPSKAEHLAKLFDERGVTLDFVPDSGMHIHAYIEQPRIEAGWPALETLWCASYAYIALYQTRYASQQMNAHRFHIGSHELSLGRDLYDWSLDRLKGVRAPDWPADLPLPTRAPSADFDKLVLELFLVAVAWILHHECGHQFLHRRAATGMQKQDLEWG